MLLLSICHISQCAKCCRAETTASPVQEQRRALRHGHEAAAARGRSGSDESQPGEREGHAHAAIMSLSALLSLHSPPLLRCLLTMVLLLLLLLAA